MVQACLLLAHEKLGSPRPTRQRTGLDQASPCYKRTHRQTRTGNPGRVALRLLAFFSVERNAAKPRAVFLQLKLLCSRLSEHDVVDIASFLANQIGRLFLLLAFGHSGSEFVLGNRVEGKLGRVLCKSIRRLTSSLLAEPDFRPVFGTFGSRVASNNLGFCHFEGHGTPGWKNRTIRQSCG